MLDYIEKGQGETVLLLHSTAAGNKQWRKPVSYTHLTLPTNREV